MLDMQDIIKVDDKFNEYCESVKCKNSPYNMICFLANHELINEENFSNFAQNK